MIPDNFLEKCSGEKRMKTKNQIDFCVSSFLEFQIENQHQKFGRFFFLYFSIVFARFHSRGTLICQSFVIFFFSFFLFHNFAVSFFSLQIFLNCTFSFSKFLEKSLSRTGDAPTIYTWNRGFENCRICLSRLLLCVDDDARDAIRFNCNLALCECVWFLAISFHECKSFAWYFFTLLLLFSDCACNMSAEQLWTSKKFDGGEINIMVDSDSRFDCNNKSLIQKKRCNRNTESAQNEENAVTKMKWHKNEIWIWFHTGKKVNETNWCKDFVVFLEFSFSQRKKQTKFQLAIEHLRLITSHSNRNSIRIIYLTLEWCKESFDFSCHQITNKKRQKKNASKFFNWKI